MPIINDDDFMRQTLDNQDAGKVFNQRQFNPADLAGIGNKEAWGIKHALGNIIGNSTSEDDKYPAGTLVEFRAPDGVEYKGKVASKSGVDYIVEVTQGESYIVPEGKLATVTPESDRVKEAMRRYIAPTIEVVGKPIIEIIESNLVFSSMSREATLKLRNTINENK